MGKLIEFLIYASLSYFILFIFRAVLFCTDPEFNYQQGKVCFSSTNVQTSSGDHPASYSMSTGGFFRRNKAAGAWG